MSARVLVDTNVLVYAYDRAAPQKQQQAIAVLDQLVQEDIGALTTQILAEFFVTVTRKLAAPLSAADAYSYSCSSYARALVIPSAARNLPSSWLEDPSLRSG
ncbi:MAG: hypothetical protein HXY37_06270 [Chloroflexi bacterium]|nr:hypothetical protein [Chloroflexota bacterium]